MGSRGGPRGRLMGSRGAPEAVLGGLGGVILRKTKIMQHKIAIRCDLEPSWARLGPVLGRLGPLLGPSWGHLGAILGPSWAILGPSWGHLGVILAHLGATLGLPRALLLLLASLLLQDGLQEQTIAFRSSEIAVVSAFSK